MKFNPKIPVYGDISYRGDCPTESAEQITFFSELRRRYPHTLGVVAVHIKNEGRRTHGQAQWQHAEGLTKGAADIIIPGATAFVCELKRQDHTKSRFQDGQERYLLAAQDAGAFVCVALGWKAAMEAVEAWQKKPRQCQG